MVAKLEIKRLGALLALIVILVLVAFHKKKKIASPNSPVWLTAVVDSCLRQINRRKNRIMISRGQELDKICLRKT